MKKTYVHLSSEINFRTMNRIYAFLLVLMIFGCKSDGLTNQNTTAPAEVKFQESMIAMNTYENLLSNYEPYELKFKMNKLENDVYDFVIDLRLIDGSYYVSPNAKRDFKGKFTILMNDSSALQPISKLNETPLSIEEFDPHPFVNGTVNWVRENTTYNQKLQRTSEKDFMVFGMIQFTIEPRCTLEKIPFSIKYSDGEMKVEIDRC